MVEAHPLLIVDQATNRVITLRVMEQETIIVVHVTAIIIRVNQILITHQCFEDCLKKLFLAFLAVDRHLIFLNTLIYSILNVLF